MKEFYQKYQDYLPAIFFAGGFLFDLMTTDRIDQTFSLIQQAVYLSFIFIFLYWEVATPRAFLRPDSKLSTLWKYHVVALHFFLGSLLSLYTIFYFKSASLMTSFLFLFVLASLLVANELPQVHRQGLKIRAALFALCLSSYFIYLVPVVTGEIGWIAFTLSMVLSVSLFLYLCVVTKKSVYTEVDVTKQMLGPGLIVQILFILLYTFKVLPPVPLSLKYIGIYQDIKKDQGTYYLSYERPWWKVWQSGAQTFIKRDGDKVYCFVSVFSPTQFEDQLKIVWHVSQNGEWKAVDEVGLSIVGGRDQGFRGFAYKANFGVGEWQVRILTSDQREIGRLGFDVVEADTETSRVWKQDLY